MFFKAQQNIFFESNSLFKGTMDEVDIKYQAVHGGRLLIH